MEEASKPDPEVSLDMLLTVRSTVTLADLCHRKGIPLIGGEGDNLVGMLYEYARRCHSEKITMEDVLREKFPEHYAAIPSGPKRFLPVAIAVSGEAAKAWNTASRSGKPPAGSDPDELYFVIAAEQVREAIDGEARSDNLRVAAFAERLPGGKLSLGIEIVRCDADSEDFEVLRSYPITALADGELFVHNFGQWEEVLITLKVEDIAPAAAKTKKVAKKKS